MKVKALLALTLLLASFAAAAQSDWNKVTTKDGAMSISAPQGWVLNDDTDPKFKKQIETFKQNNADWASKMKDDTNLSLMMYNLGESAPGKPLENFSVISQKNPGITEKDYKALGNEIAKGYKPAKGKFEQKVVKLPIGNALTYSMTIEIVAADGSKMLADMLGYAIVKGDKFFIITFATGGDQLKVRRELFTKIVESATIS